jgi:hypothetical protein
LSWYALGAMQPIRMRRHLFSGSCAFGVYRSERMDARSMAAP